MNNIIRGWAHRRIQILFHQGKKHTIQNFIMGISRGDGGYVPMFYISPLCPYAGHDSDWANHKMTLEVAQSEYIMIKFEVYPFRKLTSQHQDMRLRVGACHYITFCRLIFCTLFFRLFVSPVFISNKDHLYEKGYAFLKETKTLIIF